MFPLKIWKHCHFGGGIFPARHSASFHSPESFPWKICVANPGDAFHSLGDAGMGWYTRPGERLQKANWKMAMWKSWIFPLKMVIYSGFSHAKW